MAVYWSQQERTQREEECVSHMVGIDVLVVSLQNVPCCVLTLLFVLLHRWMRNSIACVPVGALTHQRISSDLELLPMVILTLLLSHEIGGPLGLALETVDIQKIRAKILAQHA